MPWTLTATALTDVALTETTVVSLPTPVGENVTPNVHVAPAERAVEQPLLAIAKSFEPPAAIVGMPEATPPMFFTVKVCSGAGTVPATPSRSRTVTG